MPFWYLMCCVNYIVRNIFACNTEIVTVLHSNILFRFKSLKPNLMEQKMCNYLRYKLQYHFKIIIIISSSSTIILWQIFINMYRI